MASLPGEGRDSATTSAGSSPTSSLGLNVKGRNSTSAVLALGRGTDTAVCVCWSLIRSRKAAEMLTPAASGSSSSSESSRFVMTMRSFSGSYHDWDFIFMSFSSFSDGGSPDNSGVVGSSMEVGCTIGYVSSKSIGAGEGVRVTGRSRTEGFEELGDGYDDAYESVWFIGWFIARCAKPRSKVEHLWRFVDALADVRKGLESPTARSDSSLSEEEGDKESFRLLDGMLNHG